MKTNQSETEQIIRRTIPLGINSLPMKVAFHLGTELIILTAWSVFPFLGFCLLGIDCFSWFRLHLLSS